MTKIVKKVKVQTNRVVVLLIARRVTLMGN